MIHEADSTGVDRANEGSSELVLLPEDRSVAEATCAASWQEGSLGSTGVVWVTGSGGPDDAVSALRSVPGGMPASVDVVSIGESVRSASAQASGPRATTIPFEPSDLTVHALPSARDLSTVGEAIMDRVEALDRAGQEVVVCFDALDRLLEAHHTETVFRFLHVVAGQIRSIGGRIHVSVDPDAIDEATLGLLRPIFDDVVR